MMQRLQVSAAQSVTFLFPVNSFGHGTWRLDVPWNYGNSATQTIHMTSSYIMLIGGTEFLTQESNQIWSPMLYHVTAFLLQTLMCCLLFVSAQSPHSIRTETARIFYNSAYYLCWLGEWTWKMTHEVEIALVPPVSSARCVLNWDKP